MIDKGYKSGFFSIIGCPNVGKSTLLNTLIGQKIAIVSDRAQTTRNRITGILTEKDYQMIFLDTPGMMEPRNKLGQFMQKTAESASLDTEAVIAVFDAVHGFKSRDQLILEKLKQIRIPKIAVLNKIDAVGQETIFQLHQSLESTNLFEHILDISAIQGTGVESLLNVLKEYLVEGPQYYPEDMVTDQPERLIVAEIIREKALLLLKDEVPHGIGVETEKMETRPDGNLMDIWATIYCERDSHKGIIIGKGGKMLKKIGMEARKDIEWLLDIRVNLQLWIKVKEDWRNRQQVLNELGYKD